MSQARKMMILILLGVAVLTLSLIVLIRNRDIDKDLLAVIGLLGGLAIVVNILPLNGNGKNGSKGKD